MPAASSRSRNHDLIIYDAATSTFIYNPIGRPGLASLDKNTMVTLRIIWYNFVRVIWHSESLSINAETGSKSEARKPTPRCSDSHCGWLGSSDLFATEDGKRYRPIGWMFIMPFVLFVIYGPGLSHVARGRGGMGRASGCFVEFAPRTRSPKDYLECSCNWGLVGAAQVLPIAPPGSLWWRFADEADGGNLNEEIGWPELVQTIASIRDSLPVEDQILHASGAGNYARPVPTG